MLLSTKHATLIIGQNLRFPMTYNCSWVTASVTPRKYRTLTSDPRIFWTRPPGTILTAQHRSLRNITPFEANQLCQQQNKSSNENQNHSYQNNTPYCSQEFHISAFLNTAESAKTCSTFLVHSDSTLWHQPSPPSLHPQIFFFQVFLFSCLRLHHLMSKLLHLNCPSWSLPVKMLTFKFDANLNTNYTWHSSPPETFLFYLERYVNLFLSIFTTFIKMWFSAAVQRSRLTVCRWCSAVSPRKTCPWCVFKTKH